MVNPSDYVLSNNLQKLKVSQIVEEFADELMTISGMCMDVGCGPGDITRNILFPSLAPGATIIGTDISEEMVGYGNNVYANDQIIFEPLDIQSENLPKKYISNFDHIFSFHALHWCSDIRLAFENIYNMLRPGGTILTLIVTSHDIFDIFNKLSHDSRYVSYIEDKNRLISPFQYSSKPQREMKNMLKNIGFEVSHCSNRETSYVDDANKFLSSIISFTSFLDKMPENLTDEFLNEFRDEYMNRKVCKGLFDVKTNTILDIYPMLIVYARKPY